MAVIVSSQITKNGSVISGNIKQIAVVYTAAGYSSNPGHAGSGTVVHTVCTAASRRSAAADRQ